MRKSRSSETEIVYAVKQIARRYGVCENTVYPVAREVRRAEPQRGNRGDTYPISCAHWRSDQILSFDVRRSLALSSWC